MEEIIIHALQERRQREWHTHSTVTGIAMTTRAVGGVQFSTPWFTHNYSGYSQQQYANYQPHCFIPMLSIFYTDYVSQ